MILLETYGKTYKGVISYYNKNYAFLISYRSNIIVISFSINVFYYSIKPLLVIFSLFIGEIERLGD